MSIDHHLPLATIRLFLPIDRYTFNYCNLLDKSEFMERIKPRIPQFYDNPLTEQDICDLIDVMWVPVPIYLPQEVEVQQVYVKHLTFDAKIRWYNEDSL